MKILVTGGAGFIGSFLVDGLVKEGHQVTVFDDLESQVHPEKKLPAYFNRRAKFIKGDVRRPKGLKEAIRDIEVIFHFAAAVGIGQSEYKIKRYVETNIGGTANLLDILVNSKNRVKKIILAASMSEYGEGEYECPSCGIIQPALRTLQQLKKNAWELYCPFCKRPLKPVATREQARLNINSIYAISKKTQEEMVLNIGKTYGIPAVVFRFFNVYGPRQSLSNPYTGVMAIFLSRIKNNQSPIIYEDGKQSRDFISVHDIVRANILALEKKEADYQVFNLGSGKAISIKRIAEILAGATGKLIAPEITHKFRKGDVRHCFAALDKIKKVLGFYPKITLKDGVAELVDWSKTVEAKDFFGKAAGELKQKGLI
ncbi:MAG: nucleoside-diphosphate-sugar epimerase [bacterium (Candidatus Ratteibacteria) CG_4_10_14_3_um_filter_41_18]|uniref:Nucleoside-diphosphate-sugar epimerase n=4 Tax=Candidatus Ratteibacteria TaxID=2979319 RepID=A0A2M7E6M4_9BACT|nr:MAG: nucleoside-diphosphate-sugar epimerase [bacterium (Candidatus Ratteibacteria) CG01_land_8_20_14_3_00_40_19]PIW33901.1 MAG: nucleoside-diphosphate-sugar epimerase [bacterium (Candidatus Ratteibacteria) CG15_BIG_FIL_POST_REV_8_21_14_020_41_12]PIX77325.1 MAG: nucleoside-diphosphate-sugar epimerase [bacterium (Candidatus Ratteibacteria) CG_4_10_14_3_um_filter_41_18]PJA61951.1 MAG: nucleoside-diphosphate-sugar epimerase [bacterium (Candidatus Ratteibacteria) CG_4_9_14_3_um_filter_41_21]HCG76